MLWFNCTCRIILHKLANPQIPKQKQLILNITLTNFRPLCFHIWERTVVTSKLVGIDLKKFEDNRGGYFYQNPFFFFNRFSGTKIYLALNRPKAFFWSFLKSLLLYFQLTSMRKSPEKLKFWLYLHAI